MSYGEKLTSVGSF